MPSRQINSTMFLWNLRGASQSKERYFGKFSSDFLPQNKAFRLRIRGIIQFFKFYKILSKIGVVDAPFSFLSGGLMMMIPIIIDRNKGGITLSRYNKNWGVRKPPGSKILRALIESEFILNKLQEKIIQYTWLSWVPTSHTPNNIFVFTLLIQQLH